MPRLLIIPPHFPPLNTPDMQRVRMSLPQFVAVGCVTVSRGHMGINPHHRALLHAHYGW
jgi:hypothetical protein